MVTWYHQVIGPTYLVPGKRSSNSNTKNLLTYLPLHHHLTPQHCNYLPFTLSQHPTATYTRDAPSPHATLTSKAGRDSGLIFNIAIPPPSSTYTKKASFPSAQPVAYNANLPPNTYSPNSATEANMDKNSINSNNNDLWPLPQLSQSMALPLRMWQTSST